MFVRLKQNTSTPQRAIYISGIFKTMRAVNDLEAVYLVPDADGIPATQPSGFWEEVCDSEVTNYYVLKQGDPGSFGWQKQLKSLGE